MLAWLDRYLNRVIESYNTLSSRSVSRHSVSSRAAGFVPTSTYPFAWSRMSIQDLLQVYASQTWDGQLDVNEFASMLQRLWNVSPSEAASLAIRLFPALDRDASGLMDFREMFIGMVTLCSDSSIDKLRAVFDIIDSDRSGRISRTELEDFLRAIAPWHTSKADILIMAVTILREADDNNSGYITYAEVRALHCNTASPPSLNLLVSAF